MKKRFSRLMVMLTWVLILVGTDCTILSAADINGDGKIGLQELVYVLQVISKTRSDVSLAGDLDGDGATDLQDAIYGLKIVTGHFTTNSLGMTFVSVVPGTFTMGSPESEGGRDNDETPHTVALTKSFYMQTTEVTQGQWEAVMGKNPSYFQHCGDNCPAESVSWEDVQTFITLLNQRDEGTYRLPTEAEWEYAARAGTETAFANGDITNTEGNCGDDPNLREIGWYCNNSCVSYAGGYDCSDWAGLCSSCGTQQTAEKQANLWGLYDMHGNVYEWVQDWYGDYPTENVINPAGPSSGTGKVIRGGGWESAAVLCRSAFRFVLSATERYAFVGFRLVREPIR